MKCLMKRRFDFFFFFYIQHVFFVTMLSSITSRMILAPTEQAAPVSAELPESCVQGRWASNMREKNGLTLIRHTLQATNVAPMFQSGLLLSMATPAPATSAWLNKNTDDVKLRVTLPVELEAEDAAELQGSRSVVKGCSKQLMKGRPAHKVLTSSLVPGFLPQCCCRRIRCCQ